MFVTVIKGDLDEQEYDTNTIITFDTAVGVVANGIAGIGNAYTLARVTLLLAKQLAFFLIIVINIKAMHVNHYGFN